MPVRLKLKDEVTLQEKVFIIDDESIEVLAEKITYCLIRNRPRIRKPEMGKKK
jgi:hypothetical protein